MKGIQNSVLLPLALITTITLAEAARSTAIATAAIDYLTACGGTNMPEPILSVGCYRYASRSPASISRLVQAQDQGDLPTLSPEAPEITRSLRIRIIRSRCSKADSTGLVYLCKLGELIKENSPADQQFVNDPKSKIIISGFEDCSESSKCNTKYDDELKGFLILFPRQNWFTEDFIVDVLAVKLPF